MASIRVPLWERTSFSPRYEWYKDRDGLITGLSHTLQEATATLEYKMLEGFLTRLEYRRD